MHEKEPSVTDAHSTSSQKSNEKCNTAIPAQTVFHPTKNELESA